MVIRSVPRFGDLSSWLLASAMCFALAGCVAMPATTPVIYDAEVQQDSPRKKLPTKVEKHDTQPKEIEKDIPAEPLIVVVSHQNPFHAEVATQIAARAAAPVEIIDLKTLVASNDALARLAAAPPGRLVFIGDTVIDELSGKTPKSIEVLALSRAGRRGISAFPSATMQLSTWKAHFPEASRIGVVASDRFQPLINDLVQAAAANGLTMEVRIADSDRAAQIEFRRMTALVDGVFLLPDPRILTPDLIRDVVDHSRHNGLKLLAYNSFMLELSVDLVLTLNAVDVADGVTRLLANPSMSGFDLTTFALSTPVSRQVVGGIPPNSNAGSVAGRICE